MKVIKQIRKFLDEEGLPYTVPPDDNSSILLPYPTNNGLLVVIVSIEPELGWLRITAPILKRLNRKELLEMQLLVSELNNECAFGAFELDSKHLVVSFRATMPLDDKNDIPTLITTQFAKALVAVFYEIDMAEEKLYKGHKSANFLPLSLNSEIIQKNASLN